MTRRRRSSVARCASARRSTATSSRAFEDAPFEALPFTTKDEIRESLAAEPPLGRHLAAPLEAVRRVYSTAARPATSYIAVTDADLAGWIEIGARSYAATGIVPGQRAVLTYNSGPFVAGAVLDAWSRIGATRSRSAAVTPSGWSRRSRCLGAEALGCTPSYALYLADWCRERGIEPARARRARFSVAGEPGGGEDATGTRSRGVRRDRARGDGDRRRLALAVGRVRGAGRHALLRRPDTSTRS